MNGQLEFFNVDEFEIMNAGEHFMCTDIEWDPTGRYVATSVTSVHQMENGFNIWSWNGHLLYRQANRLQTASNITPAGRRPYSGMPAC
jgi:translation initiation factor 3 subunit B